MLVLASTYPRWSGDPEPGFVHELAKRLTFDFEVLVLCPHAKGAAPLDTMDGVEIVRYRYAPAFMETLVNNGGIVANLRSSRWKVLLVPSFVLMQAWQAWCLSRKGNIDVVHAHWLIPQGLIATLLRKPFLVTSHGADLYALRGRYLQALKRFVLRKSSAATVVSNAMRKVAIDLGADTRKLSVLPMGVDMADRFIPSNAVVRSGSELLFVGRLVEKKGLRHLLDALPTVLQTRPDVTLTIAGFGPDEERLRKQIRSLKLDGVVNFIGAIPQKDLPKLYQRAALFVAPFVEATSGDQEGLGLVLVEAISCGCPVLCGDVPAVSDVVDESWRVDVRNTLVLAERVVTMLTNLHELQNDTLVLRKHLSNRLCWSSITKSYAQLLKSACDKESV